jgi:subtilisin family serine protease
VRTRDTLFWGLFATGLGLALAGCDSSKQHASAQPTGDPLVVEPSVLPGHRYQTPVSLVDTGEELRIPPLQPVVGTLQVASADGTHVVAVIGTRDPFSRTYQFPDGSIVVTNDDIGAGYRPQEERVPEVVAWKTPDGVELDVYRSWLSVAFVPEATAEQIRGVLDGHALHVVMSHFEPRDDGLPGNAIAVFQLELPLEETPTLDAALAALAEEPLVARATPALAEGFSPAYSPPNDPRYIAGQCRPVNVFGVDTLQEASNGTSSQVLAVLDSGVFGWHEDFAGPNYRKISWVGVDLWDRSYEVKTRGGWPDRNVVDGPDRNHGTACAGVVTAAVNNGKGVASLAPSSVVLPLRAKLITYNGKLVFSPFSLLKGIRALRFEFAHGQWTQKVRVVSMSLGGAHPPSGIPGLDYLDMKEQIQRDLNRNDRLYVAAAGNEASERRSYPAAFSNVLGVSALITDPTGTQWHRTHYRLGGGSNFISDNFQTYPLSGLYGFTEYGRAMTTDAPPRASEPGYSATNTSAHYGDFGGTSMATPQVASLAITLYSLRPDATRQEVEARMISTRNRATERYPIAGIVDWRAALRGWAAD